MTNNKVEKLKDGILQLHGEGGALLFCYDSVKLIFSEEKMEIEDSKIREVWGTSIRRLVFQYKTSPLKDKNIFRVEPLK